MSSETERYYIAIDLKSFYASVECVERKLNPLDTNLVVADVSRTSRTICLAVSPSLKKYGIPGRARLFEVEQKVREANIRRQHQAPAGRLTGSSSSAEELEGHPELSLDYLKARPRMALYMEYSTRIYHIYLRYIAPEDIHVYSIDEVFIDVTPYLSVYGLSPHELAMKLIHEVRKETGITATAGIGTNLYLAKIAMDIVAKHMPADSDGVRIAELDEKSYRRLLWDHRPITDFWRVGRGYAGKLAEVGLFTMGDVARCSLGASSDYYNEELLYHMFGVNAELLIDHAWGWEPCRMQAIRDYRPEYSSMGSGQVLQAPYDCGKTRLVLAEMTELLVLDLLDQGMVTDQCTLTIGYDVENLKDPERRKKYRGPVTEDRYGRKVPKHAHGTINFSFTSSFRIISGKVLELYDGIIDSELLVRRIHLTANHVKKEQEAAETGSYEQMDLFTDYEAREKERQQEQALLQKEKDLQKAVLDIKKKYGKNAVLRGMNYREGATARSRNRQIGGHHE